MSFVPNGSVFNLAAHWATYLSFYTLVKDKDITIPFPGTENAHDTSLTQFGVIPLPAKVVVIEFENGASFCRHLRESSEALKTDWLWRSSNIKIN
jgi:hypothetical protein